MVETIFQKVTIGIPDLLHIKAVEENNLCRRYEIYSV